MREWIGVLLSCSFLLLVADVASATPAVSGSESSDLNVRQNTGAAQISIPIPAPPGAGGFRPQLSLDYSSHAGDGPFGVGWRLKMPEVTRSTRFGVPDDYSSGPDGPFELGGELLVSAGSEGGDEAYRIKTETFQRILWKADDSWEVMELNGTVARYGADAATRIVHGPSGKTARWLLTQLEDANGNQIDFEWASLGDVGTAYLISVAYTHRSDGLEDGTEKRITFVYDVRPDPIRGFPGGVEMEMTQRVVDIQVTVETDPYRRLWLEYSTGAEYTTHRSRLTSVQVFGNDCPPTVSDPTAGGSGCSGLPAQTFTYRDPVDDLGAGESANWGAAPPLTWGIPTFFEEERGVDNYPIDLGVRLADLNADGRPDLIRGYDDNGTLTQTVWINTGSGWADSSQSSEAAAFEAAFVALRASSGQLIAKRYWEQEPDLPITFSRKGGWAKGADQSDYVAPVVAEFVDLNSDGRADLVGSARFWDRPSDMPTAWVSHVWINNGTGWDLDPALSSGWSTVDPGFPAIVGFAAEIKSGRADLKDDTVPMSATGNGILTRVDEGVRFADLNGDRLVDVVARRHVDPALVWPFEWASTVALAATAYNTAYLQTETAGWQLATQYAPPAGITGPECSSRLSESEDYGARLVDLNGDGLDDFVRTDPLGDPNTPGCGSDFPVSRGPTGVWINTGGGWCGVAEGCNEAQSLEPPFSFTYFGSDEFYKEVTSSGLIYADLNGDGFLDILRTDGLDEGEREAWLYDPSHSGPGNTPWVADTRFVPPLGMETTWSWGGFGHDATRGVRLADANGDGAIDFLRSYESETQEEVQLGVYVFADRLSQVDNGRGGVVDVAYLSAVSQRDGDLDAAAEADWGAMGGGAGEPDSGMESWPALPVVVQVVAHDNLDGEAFTTNYTYAHPRSCPEWRSRTGFRLVDTVEDDGSGRRLFYHQQHGIAGRASREERRNDEGQLVWEGDSTWVVVLGDTVEGSTAGALVGRLTGRTSSNVYPTGVGATRVETFGYDDGYGYGFVDLVITDRPTGILTVDRTPFTDPLGRVIGLAAAVVRTGGGQTLSDESRQYASGRGLITQRSRLAAPRDGSSSGSWLTESWTYDGYGNRRSHTDALGRIEYYCFDGDTQFEDATGCTSTGSSNGHAVLTATKDRLGEVSFYEHDLGSGARNTETTWAGDLHTWERDALGRIEAYKFTPLGEAQVTMETRSWGEGSPTVRAFRSVLREVGSGETVRSAEYFDAFGNVVRTARDGANGNTVGTARIFDHSGRATYVSYDQPCVQADCDDIPTVAPLPPGVHTTFDALGRVTSRTTPDGTEGLTYDSDASLQSGELDLVVHRDALENQTRRWMDGDRVAWVEECESTCGSGVFTRYVYAPTGELTDIYDALNNRLAFEFDTLGRTLSVDDPDGGKSTMTYTATGQLESRKNARDQTTWYFYDALGRPAIIDREDSADVTLTYDPRTRERDIVEVPGADGYTLDYDYDEFGRREQLVQTVRAAGFWGGGHPYPLVARWEYDRLGRVTAIDTPESGTRLVYVYQGDYLKQVCETAGDDCISPDEEYISSVTYDSLGRRDKVHMPAGVLDRDFDPSTYRMKRKLFTNEGGEKLLDLTLGYDFAGNVASVIDGVATSGFDATATYRYDHRNRLEKHNLQGTDKWFTYDWLGNLTGRDVAFQHATNQTYGDPSRPHAITAGPAGTYAYDDDGNMTDRAGQGLEWDSHNRLVCIDDDGSCGDESFDVRHFYDLDGNRLWTRIGEGTEEQLLIYFGDLLMWDRGADRAEIHVSAFGRRIATKYEGNPGLLTAETRVFGTPIDLEPGAILLVLAWAGGFALLILAIRDGVPRRMAERPLSASLVVLAASGLVVPPQASAGVPPPGGHGMFRRWLFHDHLGTNVLVTRSDGTLIRRRLFDPFGKLLAEDTNAEPHERLFTGQRWEDASGLYDFKQRWYDAETGRFLGVDPVVQSLPDPQALNTYGYVRNNPTNRVDPDGRLNISIGGLWNAEALGAGLRNAVNNPALRKIFIRGSPTNAAALADALGGGGDDTEGGGGDSEGGSDSQGGSLGTGSGAGKTSAPARAPGATGNDGAQDLKTAIEDAQRKIAGAKLLLKLFASWSEQDIRNAHWMHGASDEEVEQVQMNLTASLVRIIIKNQQILVANGVAQGIDNTPGFVARQAIRGPAGALFRVLRFLSSMGHQRTSPTRAAVFTCGATWGCSVTIEARGK